jgi:hypothetical protein
MLAKGGDRKEGEKRMDKLSETKTQNQKVRGG